MKIKTLLLTISAVMIPGILATSCDDKDIIPVIVEKNTPSLAVDNINANISALKKIVDAKEKGWG